MSLLGQLRGERGGATEGGHAREGRGVSKGPGAQRGDNANVGTLVKPVVQAVVQQGHDEVELNAGAGCVLAVRGRSGVARACAELMFRLLSARPGWPRPTPVQTLCTSPALAHPLPCPSVHTPACSSSASICPNPASTLNPNPHTPRLLRPLRRATVPPWPLA